MGAPVTLVDPNGVYVDASGGGSGTSEVEVTNFPATQPVSGTVAVSGSVAVTGPLTNAQLTAQGLMTNDQFTGSTGLLSAGPYSDDTGAGDGSVIGLLKGIYVQNAQMIALLTQIETNTGA